MPGLALLLSGDIAAAYCAPGEPAMWPNSCESPICTVDVACEARDACSREEEQQQQQQQQQEQQQQQQQEGVRIR
jgi:hypothetical protein